MRAQLFVSLCNGGSAMLLNEGENSGQKDDKQKRNL